jgi:chemotaxis protein methyltransferase CheR
MSATDTLMPENYSFLQKHVHSCSGIVLDQGKEYLFACRLSPIISRLGIPSLDGLCDILRSGGGGDLGRQVVEAMTTNETYFFRDPTHYNAIREQFLAATKAKLSSRRRLRFWSAAASTGQEAYSLAMLLLQEGFSAANAEIVGTDFSSAVLERARAGRYHQIEVNRGLAASLLVKYFNRVGVDWELKESVRDLVRFRELDLRGDLSSLGGFDLVFCRNVLIYFDADTRLKIFKEVRARLEPGGWLLLGGAETSPGIDAWFERRLIAGAVIYVAR